MKKKKQQMSIPNEENIFKTVGTFYGIICYCLSTKHQKEILYPILFGCEEELRHYPKDILRKALDLYLKRYQKHPLTFKQKQEVLLNFLEDIPFIDKEQNINEKESTRTTAENSFY